MTMKNLKSNIQATLFLAIFLISTGNVFGQKSTTTNPTETITSVFSDDDEGEPTVRIQINGAFDTTEESDGYVKVSVSNSYRYTSHFKKDLTNEIVEIITKEWGEPSFNTSNLKKWNHINGKTIEDFELKLKSGKVKVKYKSNDPEVMKSLEELTKKICKATYQSNCE